MFRILFLFIMPIFFLSACTQNQPRPDGGSPFINTYKKAEQIKKTTEDRKDATEQALKEDVVEEDDKK